MEAFTEYMLVSFTRRLFSHFSVHHPELFAEYTEGSFLAFVRRASQAGAIYHLRSESELAEWVLICRRNPQLLDDCPAWAEEILLFPGRSGERKLAYLRNAIGSQT